MLVQPKIKCHCDNCSLDYWMFNNRENICSCLSNLNYILRINGAVVPLNGLFVSRFSRECSRYLQNSAESQKTISRNRYRKIRRSSVQPWSTLLIVSHWIWRVFARQNFQNRNFQEKNTRESLLICTKEFLGSSCPKCFVFQSMLISFR